MLCSKRIFAASYFRMDSYQAFLDNLRSSIAEENFIKLSLGNYKGFEKDLKNIFVKAVLIKREFKLSFTYRYQTKDITKNYSLEEGVVVIQSYLQEEGFRISTLFTETQNIVCQLGHKGDWQLKHDKATGIKPQTLTHDKQKERKIDSTSKSYLQELKLTDANGIVYKNAQDKWRQINHYIELLSSLLKDLPTQDVIHIVDMGAGKGYLTFALYDYLTNELHKATSIIGVEYRADLVEFCNGVASKAKFDGLSFIEGTIEDYAPKKKDLNVLIALHACDTATDDAIYKGISHQADLIVVAPCCHKQVRRELEKVKAKNELDFMTKHGIFLERHAEMLTDGIRALILEYHGYQTKVVQFISDAHTPKNVMIMAVRKEVTAKKQQEILVKLRQTKSYFGIDYHHLERLCGLESAN